MLIILHKSYLALLYFFWPIFKSKTITKTEKWKWIVHTNLFTWPKHTLDILLIETLKVVFWFNPYFTSLKKAIQLNHEFLGWESSATTMFRFIKILTVRQTEPNLLLAIWIIQ
jgi:hypothetical protein